MLGRVSNIQRVLRLEMACIKLLMAELRGDNLSLEAIGVGNLSSITSEFLAGIYYINDIIVWDNGNSSEVFVAVGGFVYQDAGNPYNWLGLQSAGLYRSVDGGAAWSRMESEKF